MSRSGRTQLFPNVLASGLAYVVAVGIGFIMPRIIFESLGQSSLGLWDLGWSFLVYLSFSGVGLGSAIAHYIASHPYDGKAAALSQVSATGVWCQLAFAALLATTFVLGFSVIAAAVATFGSEASESVWYIGLFVGMTVGLVVFGDAAQGILVGCHHARTAEYINMCHDVALALSMIAVLLAGYGIIGLAVVTFAARLVAEILRFWLAYRIHVDFSAKPHAVSWSTAKELIRYGVKTTTFAFQEIMVFQAVRLVLFFGAGPAALAAFSRYATIARQIGRIVDRLSIALPPLAGGFLVEGDDSRIRSLYLNSSHGGLLLTLPILAVFGVFGDTIVHIWMGPDFIIANISWIFAAGALLHANYSISNRILSGINAHGRIALACLSLSAFVLTLICFSTYPLDLFGAAATIMCVMLFTVHLPYVVYAGTKLDIPFIQNLTRVYLKPLAINVGFLAVLYLARVLSDAHYVFSASALTLAGTVALLAGYWVFALDRKTKTELTETLRSRLQARRAPG